MSEESATAPPVVCNHVPNRDQAAAVASRLRSPLMIGVNPAELQEPGFILLYDQDGLAWQKTGPRAPGPIRVDFVTGGLNHRRRFGGGKGQMIAKAAGVKAGVYPSILDLTAGLGRDGFILASLGCTVTLVERSPVVHLLLEDGLARARRQVEDPDLCATLDRLTLVHAEGRNYLAQMGDDQHPDVVYLDPMFPEREKTAQVKKEMRSFHQLVGRDQDADLLLVAALAKARYRVLVKRPRKAPSLGNNTPTYQLTGKSSRFDIYALRKLPDTLHALP